MITMRAIHFHRLHRSARLDRSPGHYQSAMVSALALLACSASNESGSVGSAGGGGVDVVSAAGGRAVQTSANWGGLHDTTAESVTSVGGESAGVRSLPGAGTAAAANLTTSGMAVGTTTAVPGAGGSGGAIGGSDGKTLTGDGASALGHSGAGGTLATETGRVSTILGGNAATIASSQTSSAATAGGTTAAGGASSHVGGARVEGGSSNQAIGGSADTSETLPQHGEPCAGYTLLGMPESNTGGVSPAKLVNMAGEIVHTWDIGGFPPKMLPGGSLVGCVGVIGTYDCVELRQVSWDGELEWSFSDFLNIDGETTASRQHHDLQREGNPVGFYAPGQSFVNRGRTLVLAHEPRLMTDIRSRPILDDVIYEVDWDGALVPDGFRWYGADHIDEFGFDATARSHIGTALPNNSQLEWLHGNSISRLGPNRWYDEGRAAFHPDNIIYSSRDANFVIIIAYPSGEVVWRIGPDFAGHPEEALGQFAGQHHAHMIPANLPGAGNILVFDNGGASGYGGRTTTSGPTRYSRSYSRVIEFDPITFELIWQYGAASGEQNFYSQFISGAQRLPNGNTLIDIGAAGRVIEVTPGKQVVWEYQNTNASGATAPVYRAYRIPPEWLPAGANESLGNYEHWSSLFDD